MYRKYENGGYVMGFLGNFFKGDNDEVLFFILVFLFLFSGNWFGKGHEGLGDDDGSILFFIILFLLLFFNNSFGREATE